MSEECLVRHCAPTLAGIKTGSLFSCPCESKKGLMDSLRRTNRRLVKKGLRCIPLKLFGKKALIYMYRPALLKRDLEGEKAKQLLKSRGYEGQSCEMCVAHLMERLQQEAEFPHEIGLFLGYPPEDVEGFIKDSGCCKCVGCWKVYGNEEEAKKKFAQYDKCTRLYCAQHANGRELERLAVEAR